MARTTSFPRIATHSATHAAMSSSLTGTPNCVPRRKPFVVPVRDLLYLLRSTPPSPLAQTRSQRNASGRALPQTIASNCHPSRAGDPGGGHFEILCAKSCKFVVHTAVCHWQRLTKCREYIVTTWASVGRGGAQTFGGGVRVLQLAGLALATGLFWRSILFWMRMRNCGLIAGNNCHNKQHLRRKDVRVRG